MTTFKKNKHAITLALVIIIAALIYSKTLQNDILQWDDTTHIVANNDIKSFSFDNIKKIFTSYYIGMYHPLVTLSFAVEYNIFGLNLTVFHTTNVLFHLANIILVYFFILLLCKNKNIALFVASLFAVHPMNTEAIAWITGRKDMMFAFFYLLALIFYIRFLRQQKQKYYWFLLTSFVFSLLSKTTAITLPLALIAIDYYYNIKPDWQNIKAKIPLFVLSFIFGVVAVLTQSDSQRYIAGSSYNLIDRVFLASYSINFYLIKLFAPINLSALHLLPLKTNGFLPAIYYISVIPILAFVFLIYRKIIVLPKYFLFGLMFFIALIFLHLHIKTVGMAVVSERYCYLSYIGLFFVIANLFLFIYQKLKNSNNVKKFILSITTICILYFGFLTYQRIGDWKDSLTLFTDAANKTNVITEINFIQSIAYSYEADNLISKKQYLEAIDYYSKAIVLTPTYPELYTNRGVAKLKLKNYKEAMQDFNTAIDIDPTFAAAYFNRAQLHLHYKNNDNAQLDLWNAYKYGIKVSATMYKDYLIQDK